MKSLLLVNWCLLVHCYHQHSVSKGAHVLVLLYIGIFYLVLIKMMKDCSRYTIYFALIMYVLTRLLPFSWLWIDTCQLLHIACFHSLFMLLVKLDIWLNKMDPPWYACEGIQKVRICYYMTFQMGLYIKNVFGLWSLSKPAL